MSRLLDTIGKHLQFIKLDNKGNEQLLFPVNTSDDVIIDEEGNTLKDDLKKRGSSIEYDKENLNLNLKNKEGEVISSAKVANMIQAPVFDVDFESGHLFMDGGTPLNLHVDENGHLLTEMTD